jgi:hypothetical protein
LKVSREAVTLLRRSAPENSSFRQDAEIALGAALGATGASSEAKQRLEAVIAETQRSGRADRNMEARLVLGTLLLGTGDGAGGRSLLDELRREASERGFALVAQKATEAASRPPARR